MKTITILVRVDHRGGVCGLCTAQTLHPCSKYREPFIVFLDLPVDHSKIHWIFRYTVRTHGCQGTFEFNDELVKEVPPKVTLTHLGLLAYLREMPGMDPEAAPKCIEPVNNQEV